MRDLRKKEKLEAAAGAALGTTLSIQRLDVCSDSSVAECMASIPGGRVDVLGERPGGRRTPRGVWGGSLSSPYGSAVNNAGVGHVGPVESVSVEEMKRIFETNFFGVVRMIKAVLPDMKRRQNGHIVVVSSVMGLQGEVWGSRRHGGAIKGGSRCAQPLCARRDRLQRRLRRLQVRRGGVL